MSATLPAEPSIPLDTGKKTSSRRQWSVQGGPRGLLRRMRSQLAEDGCPESQLVMGRTLLQQLGSDMDTEEEDARLAVFWLSQSSLQGNKEATELLQDCLNRNIGICEHNYQEIRECLAMDQQEKLARRAAHLLFCSLSDGNDFINSSSLSAKIHGLVNGREVVMEDSSEEKDDSEDCSNLEKRYGGERLVEEHLVKSSVMYCEGRVPPLHHFITPVECLNENQMVKVVSLPYRLVVKIYHKCLQFLGVVVTNFMIRILNLTNPFNSIALLLLLSALIALLNAARLQLVLPVIVVCIALIVMMISSAHMLLIRRDFDSLHMWSVVFSHYCPDLNIVHIESKFKARCWKPYISMFFALLFYLGAVPLISPKLLVNFLPSLYTFSALTFCLVPEKLSAWQFISLMLHLSTVTPGVCDSLSGCLLPFVRGSGLENILITQHIYMLEMIQLNVGIASALHLLWCLICIGALWKFGVSHLVPHIASLTWCHLAVMASQFVTSPSDLVIPVSTWCTLVILPFAMPLILTVAPGLLVASLFVHFGFEPYIGGLILIVIIALTWLLRNWWPNFILICKVSLWSGIFIYICQSSLVQKFPAVHHSNLVWENYKNVCWPSKDTGAATVHRCLPLQGTFVKWQGTVTQVEIVDVWNFPETALSVLPEGIGKPLKCYIGKKLSPCSSGKLESGQIDSCHVIQSALGSHSCVLDDWNEYTFDITVAMGSSTWKFGTSTSLIKMKADDNFRDFALGLHLGDEIEFVGSLSKNVGSLNPRLILSSVTCVNCKLKLKPVSNNEDQSHFDPWLVPTSIFNFILGPILTI